MTRNIATITQHCFHSTAGKELIIFVHKATCFLGHTCGILDTNCTKVTNEIPALLGFSALAEHLQHFLLEASFPQSHTFMQHFYCVLLLRISTDSHSDEGNRGDIVLKDALTGRGPAPPAPHPICPQSASVLCCVLSVSPCSSVYVLNGGGGEVTPSTRS